MSHTLQPQTLTHLSVGLSTLTTLTTLTLEICTVSVCAAAPARDTIKSTESFTHNTQKKTSARRRRRETTTKAILVNVTSSIVSKLNQNPHFRTSWNVFSCRTHTHTHRVLCVAPAFVGIFNFANCLTDNTIADLNTIHSEITLNSISLVVPSIPYASVVLCSTCLQIACEIAHLIFVVYECRQLDSDWMGSYCCASAFVWRGAYFWIKCSNLSEHLGGVQH